DGTGKVRALLVVGQHAPLVGPDQDAAVVLPGVGEGLRPADREVLQVGDQALALLRPAAAEDALHEDPELPDHEGEAGQHEEAEEVPPADVVVFGDVDRELLPPRRLQASGPAVGRGGAFAVGWGHAVSSST